MTQPRLFHGYSLLAIVISHTDEGVSHLPGTWCLSGTSYIPSVTTITKVTFIGCSCIPQWAFQLLAQLSQPVI